MRGCTTIHGVRPWAPALSFLFLFFGALVMCFHWVRMYSDSWHHTDGSWTHYFSIYVFRGTLHCVSIEWGYATNPLHHMWTYELIFEFLSFGPLFIRVHLKRMDNDSWCHTVGSWTHYFSISVVSGFHCVYPWANRDSLLVERRTRDRKIASSDPGRGGGRIFILQSYLCALTLFSVSVPPPCYRSGM